MEIAAFQVRLKLNSHRVQIPKYVRTAYFIHVMEAKVCCLLAFTFGAEVSSPIESSLEGPGGHNTGGSEFQIQIGLLNILVRAIFINLLHQPMGTKLLVNISWLHGHQSCFKTCP